MSVRIDLYCRSEQLSSKRAWILHYIILSFLKQVIIIKTKLLTCCRNDRSEDHHLRRLRGNIVSKRSRQSRGPPYKQASAHA